MQLRTHTWTHSGTFWVLHSDIGATTLSAAAGPLYMSNFGLQKEAGEPPGPLSFNIASVSQVVACALYDTWVCLPYPLAQTMGPRAFTWLIRKLVNKIKASQKHAKHQTTTDFFTYSTNFRYQVWPYPFLLQFLPIRRGHRLRAWSCWADRWVPWTGLRQLSPHPEDPHPGTISASNSPGWALALGAPTAVKGWRET